MIFAFCEYKSNKLVERVAIIREEMNIILVVLYVKLSW